MSKEILFYHDLGSPNAYLANQVLRPLAEKYGATIVYRPVLIGGIFKSTGNQPPWMAFGDVPSKMKYMQLEIQRYVQKHSLTKFQMNPNFPVNTLLLGRAAIVAERRAELDSFVAAGEKMMWEERRKMDDPDVFIAGFNEHGMDGEALLGPTQDDDVKAQLASNTAEAVGRGVFGIPTFFVGDNMYFGKDRMHWIEDELA